MQIQRGAVLLKFRPGLDTVVLSGKKLERGENSILHSFIGILYDMVHNLEVKGTFTLLIKKYHYFIRQ